jgi:hypothetical protein
VTEAVKTEAWEKRGCIALLAMIALLIVLISTGLFFRLTTFPHSATEMAAARENFSGEWTHIEGECIGGAMRFEFQGSMAAVQRQGPDGSWRTTRRKYRLLDSTRMRRSDYTFRVLGDELRLMSGNGSRWERDVLCIYQRTAR